MEKKISREKLEEVANRYDLKIKDEVEPGFYLEDKKINPRELIEDFFVADKIIEDKKTEKFEIKKDKSDDFIKVNHSFNSGYNGAA